MTNYNIKELDSRSPFDREYAEFMAESLRTNKPTTVRKLTEAEIIAMQPASTRKTLERDPTLDEAHYNRVVLNAMAIPGADLSTPQDLDMAVAKRELGIEEALLVQDIRQKARNTLGRSELSSVTPELRIKGIEAYIYSRPAELTKEELKKVTKLEEIKSTPLEQIKPKPSFWNKLKRFIDPTVADKYDANSN